MNHVPQRIPQNYRLAAIRKGAASPLTQDGNARPILRLKGDRINHENPSCARGQGDISKSEFRKRFRVISGHRLNQQRNTSRVQEFEILQRSTARGVIHDLGESQMVQGLTAGFRIHKQGVVKLQTKRLRRIRRGKDSAHFSDTPSGNRPIVKPRPFPRFTPVFKIELIRGSPDSNHRITRRPVDIRQLGV